MFRAWIRFVSCAGALLRAFIGELQLEGGETF